MSPGRVQAQQGLAELVDDARPAEIVARIRRVVRPHDRAVRKRLSGAVMVGDDDFQAGGLGLRDLLDGGYAAVDGQHEAAAVCGEAGERFATDAVALVETARQVPLDVGAELAQHMDGERGRTDAVDVVVPVHADPLAGGDRRPDRVARLAHGTERKRVVGRQLRIQEAPRFSGIGVAAAHEDARRRLAKVERLRQRERVAPGARSDDPAAVHGLRECRSDRTAPGSPRAVVDSP